MSDNVEHIIQFDADYASREDLFRQVSDQLEAAGIVGPEFYQALVDREKDYPTGVPTDPAVGLPHTDGTYVRRNAIVCIRNARELAWNEMCGDAADFVHPRLVFMLVMVKGGPHLQILQNIIEKIQDPALVNAALDAADEEAFKTAVNAFVA